MKGPGREKTSKGKNGVRLPRWLNLTSPSPAILEGIGHWRYYYFLKMGAVRLGLFQESSVVSFGWKLVDYLLEPADLLDLPDIEIRRIRFDIYKRCSVDNIYIFNI